MLSRYMAQEGDITPAELSRRTGVHPSRFTHLAKGESDPRRLSAGTIAKISRGTGIPLLEVIIACGIWSADELDVKVVPGDPEHLTNKDLLRLVAERLRPDTDPPPDEIGEYEPDQFGSRGAGRTGRLRAHLADGSPEVSQPESRRRAQ